MCHKFFLCFLPLLCPLFVCDIPSDSFPVYNDIGEDVLDETRKAFISGDIPFSFKYGGIESNTILSSVRVKESKRKKRKENAFDLVKRWKLKDGLTVTLKARTYRDFPAIEWSVFFTNNGKKRTQVLSDLFSLDYSFRYASLDSLEVHTNKGDDCSISSYEPYSIKLKKGEPEFFSPTPGGKSSTGERGWPYWNIQNGNKGFILALGWPGHWRCQMRKESEMEFSITAGQGSFNSYLKPGETIRTPLICMVFWKDQDLASSQNLWRRFYLSHVIPRFSGVPEKPATEIQIAQDDSSIEDAKRFLYSGIKPRICWTDAGWYPTLTGDWLETGDWITSPDRYPNGIRRFSTWAHQEGMESLLWFEPERVFNGDNYLYNNHKSWLVPSCDDCCLTLNLGDKECLEWLIGHIDSLIVANGLDWYREDLNGSGPQCLWVALDSENRQGIHENLYVQGHLALWDELKSRHPNLHIDACASGGRRNDLETMHRAVPLLRSDYQWAYFGDEYIRGNQAHTWALSAWFPFQGSAVYEYESYKYRSFYLPCFGMGALTEENVDEQRKAYAECSQIQPMMLYGDFWPLTPYSTDADRWIGWQFNRENDGDGCIQLFRRENCRGENYTVKLRGLNPKAFYILTDFDNPDTKIVSGEELMYSGAVIRIIHKPGSALLIYKRVD